jgi:hypothetical protein
VGVSLLLASMSMCLRDVVAEDGETVLTDFILEPKHKVQPCNHARAPSQATPARRSQSKARAARVSSYGARSLRACVDVIVPLHSRELGGLDGTTTQYCHRVSPSVRRTAHLAVAGVQGIGDEQPPERRELEC